MSVAVIRRSAVLSLSPLLSIFLSQAMHVYLYISFHDKPIWAFVLWSLSQAVGNITIGYLSDQNCRKKILLFTQIAGAIGLCCLLYFPDLFFPAIIFLGLCFSPIGVARASLVDNSPHVAKLKMIALSFIFASIPWSLYLFMTTQPSRLVGEVVLGVFLLNIVVCLLFFVDFRDEAIRGHRPKKISHLIHKNQGKRFWFTLGAFAPLMLAFFFTDTIVEKYPNNAKLFSIEGLGSIFASMLAFLYRRTPHTSLLTITYGICFLLSIIPGICKLFFPETFFGPAYQMIFFSILLGFYIVFVYDIALNASSANHRGAVCGMIEFIFVTTAMLSIFLIDICHLGSNFILVSLPILALSAIILQKQTEQA